MKTAEFDLFQYDEAYRRRGFQILCGVDEAGRGPLCGPVCAAAVVFPSDIKLLGLNDSKKLSEKKREELYPQITRQALSYGIAFASEAEIDEMNILNATFLAMQRAVKMLQIQPQMLLIDGNRAKGFTLPTECIIKGDTKSASIAAASVLAKVTRDRYMMELAQKYPEYGLEKHKGYPTKEHIDKLRRYGPCKIHRKSFLTHILSEGPNE